jgi:hypothetical protein
MKGKIAFASLALLLTVLACSSGQPAAGQPTPGLPPSTAADSDPTATAAPPPANMGELVQPADLEYLGAFRLPGGDDRPQTFAYGANAMTFNPDGDPSGAADGFPGSLFLTGHDRIAFGEVPDGDQVAEIDITTPVLSKNVEDLNTAGFLQDFSNVLTGHFTDLEEIPRVGMAYLNIPETGPKLHMAWGQHLQSTGTASHGWFNPTLDNPQFHGIWYIGDQDPYSVNGYMFEIPAAWADAYTGGRPLATGRYRDGGMGGMGPSLFAYRDWQDDGSAPPDGTRLQEVTLLKYESSYNTQDLVHSLNGYQHADEWEGGAFLTTASGKSAVIFAGTKATGQKFWYGYINPAGPDQVCVDAHITDYPTCRTADGGLCPSEDLTGCCSEDTGGCASMRGWWSNRFDAEIILYNPADLANVAAGQMESWQPQPYAVIDIDEYLFLNAPEWDQTNNGWGDQRRFRIGDVAFDRANGLLYLLEQYADGGKPVVHVWRIR